jgi:hypothetical protein
VIVPKPGNRVELDENSGNEGRKAFVLYVCEDSDLMVRFDGFAYNSRVPADRFRLLPDEPFRPDDDWDEAAARPADEPEGNAPDPYAHHYG